MKHSTWKRVEKEEKAFGFSPQQRLADTFTKRIIFHFLLHNCNFHTKIKKKNTFLSTMNSLNFRCRREEQKERKKNVDCHHFIHSDSIMSRDFFSLIKLRRDYFFSSHSKLHNPLPSCHWTVNIIVKISMKGFTDRFHGSDFVVKRRKIVRKNLWMVC